MTTMVLYTLTSLPMMPWPGTQALVVSRADKTYISALFANSLVRNNIFTGRLLSSPPKATCLQYLPGGSEQLDIMKYKLEVVKYEF